MIDFESYQSHLISIGYTAQEANAYAQAFQIMASSSLEGLSSASQQAKDILEQAEVERPNEWVEGAVGFLWPDLA